MTNPTCREIVELVTDYLEGAMSPDRRDLFERHLVICGGCDAYLRQMQTTIRLTGELREQDVPEPVMEDLVRAFRTWRG